MTGDDLARAVARDILWWLGLTVAVAVLIGAGLFGVCVVWFM